MVTIVMFLKICLTCIRVVHLKKAKILKYAKKTNVREVWSQITFSDFQNDENFEYIICGEFFALGWIHFEKKKMAMKTQFWGQLLGFKTHLITIVSFK